MRLGDHVRNCAYPTVFVGLVAIVWMFAAASAESGRAEAAARFIESPASWQPHHEIEPQQDSSVVFDQPD